MARNPADGAHEHAPAASRRTQAADATLTAMAATGSMLAAPPLAYFPLATDTQELGAFGHEQAPPPTRADSLWSKLTMADDEPTQAKVWFRLDAIPLPWHAHELYWACLANSLRPEEKATGHCIDSRIVLGYWAQRRRTDAFWDVTLCDGYQAIEDAWVPAVTHLRVREAVHVYVGPNLPAGSRGAMALADLARAVGHDSIERCYNRPLRTDHAETVTHMACDAVTDSVWYQTFTETHLIHVHPRHT